MYSIRLKKSAAKELQRLPGFAIHKISRALDGLEKDPRPAGAKKLEGISGSLWRIRVGDYRIIYQIDDGIKVIEVKRIGNRKDVYR